MPREGLIGPGDSSRTTGAVSVSSPPSVGMAAGKSSYATTPDLPTDQRNEDGGGLVFETEPFADPVEILGRPVLDLVLDVDRWS